jgi:hypothetical protein
MLSEDVKTIERFLEEEHAWPAILDSFSRIKAAAMESQKPTHNTASAPVCPKCGNAMAVLSGNHGFSGKVCLFCE